MSCQTGRKLVFTTVLYTTSEGTCTYDVVIKEEYFEISMSVLQEHKTAVKMLFAIIPKVPITVQINLDILEMVVKINVTKALILF